MNTTKLSSEFVMEPDLIKALKLLHSKKKPKKTSLLSLYNGVLKTMTPNLSPEVLKVFNYANIIFFILHIVNCI